MDWILVVSLLPILGAGVAIIGVGRHLLWIILGFFIFFLFSRIDWSFLKTGGVLLVFFALSVLVLFFLLFFGKTVRGSTSWFNLALFSIEPAEPIKLVLILILSKYFSRRHIDIAHLKHILISGFYAALPAMLVFLQPDLGSAAVFIFVWLGMIVVSGVSKKHLALVLVILILFISVSWFFVLKPYQKERILVFLDLLKDPQGAGYNALQSMVAVGSGRIWGKGVGYGTQSRLEFLPEYKTDFIFAAFAEEWGFVGVLIVFLSFGVLFWRILRTAYFGESNFERFYGVGMSVFFMTHFALHVGMNFGILPVTGLGLPFMSYGGSFLITSFAGLGILMGFRRHAQKFSPTEPVTE